LKLRDLDFLGGKRCQGQQKKTRFGARGPGGGGLNATPPAEKNLDVGKEERERFMLHATAHLFPRKQFLRGGFLFDRRWKDALADPSPERSSGQLSRGAGKGGHLYQFFHRAGGSPPRAARSIPSFGIGGKAEKGPSCRGRAHPFLGGGGWGSGDQRSSGSGGGSLRVHWRMAAADGGQGGAIGLTALIQKTRPDVGISMRRL